MNCERARELLAAQLLGELDDAGRRELAAHHTTCPTCRAEARADLSVWQQLGNLPEPVWSDAARARSLDALHQALRTVNSPVRRHRPWLLAASLAAAFLLGLIVPDSLRPFHDRPVVGDAAADTLPRWVLLFVDPRHDARQNTRAGPQMREMVQWVNALAAREHYVSGEKLVENQGIVLTADGTSAYAPAEIVTGFVIVRASTEAEALSLARASPVLSFGGSILVLPVDPI
jgi:anti-sigma factor RsiW